MGSGQCTVVLGDSVLARSWSSCRLRRREIKVPSVDPRWRALGFDETIINVERRWFDRLADQAIVNSKFLFFREKEGIQ